MPELQEPEDDLDNTRMSILEHLEDLRRALIWSFGGWGVATIAGIFLWRPVLEFLIQRGKQGGLTHLQLLQVQGGFTLAIKLSLYIGFILAFPIVAWRTWWFVSPGLRRSEKRFIIPLTVATVVFFLLGVAFALFTLPLFIRILFGISVPGVEFNPTADEYLGFVTILILAFGLVFELPIVLYVLGMLRIISTRWLYRNRFYWYIGMAVLASVITPGADPITPLLLFIPLVVFWEGTALVLRLSGR